MSYPPGAAPVNSSSAIARPDTGRRDRSWSLRLCFAFLGLGAVLAGCGGDRALRTDDCGARGFLGQQAGHAEPAESNLIVEDG